MKHPQCSPLLYFVLGLCTSNAIALRVLGIFPYQGKSHFFVFKSFLDELARRGHDLTVVSHFPDRSAGYTDISLAGTAKVIQEDMAADRSYLTVLQTGLFLTFTGAENCESLLSVAGVQELWRTKQKFDVVVTEQFNSDCGLGLAHALGAPVVTLTSHVLMPWHYSRVGIPDDVAFVPFHFFGGGSSPSFYQRVEAAVFRGYMNTLYKLVTQRADAAALARHFPGLPDLDELAREVKFSLLYQRFPLTGSRLLPSNAIEVGGFHVPAPEPLTGELARFVEEAPNGVVLVSFGSVVKASTLAADKLQAIVGALAQLPQRVVWKWEDDTTHRPTAGDPGNLLRMSWLPQNDILAHPNVLAFYSHGGMLGTTEAIHHGVPVVAMPILGDQPANAAAIRESGLGVYLDFNNLNTDTLLAALRQVLEPEFRARVKELSRVWHDRPLSAMDTAVYWTEFAARHRNFTFRNPAADVPWYKSGSLDVLAALLAAAALPVAGTALCCRRRSRLPRNKTTKRD